MNAGGGVRDKLREFYCWGKNGENKNSKSDSYDDDE